MSPDQENRPPQGTGPESGQEPLAKEPEAPEAQATPDQPVIDGPAWEAELDTYPLRPPEEDARWAVNTVRIWVGIALFSLFWILVFLILGFYYD